MKKSKKDNELKKQFVCKDCKMEFDDKIRLVRHTNTAHQRKRKFVNPDEYWHDSAGMI